MNRPPTPSSISDPSHRYFFLEIPKRVTLAGRIDYVSLFVSQLFREFGPATLIGRIDLFFGGYDHDAREIYEIPAIRRFMGRLLASWPSWCFYLRPGPQLPVLLACAFKIDARRRCESGAIQLTFVDEQFRPKIEEARRDIATWAATAGINGDEMEAHRSAFLSHFRERTAGSGERNIREN